MKDLNAYRANPRHLDEIILNAPDLSQAGPVISKILPLASDLGREYGAKAFALGMHANDQGFAWSVLRQFAQGTPFYQAELNCLGDIRSRRYV